MNTNPFKVYSPEEMSAEQVMKLFVPVAESLEIGGPEHVFIHGHRGCGKSMMLRTMAPDCQMIATGKQLNELPYLGIYATIKATGLDVAEYDRLKDQYAGLVLAEHSLVSFLGSKVFQSVAQNCMPGLDTTHARDEFRKFVLQDVLPRIQPGSDERAIALLAQALTQIKDAQSMLDILNAASAVLDAMYGAALDYLRRNSFTTEYQSYKGPLLGYRDFLYPVMCRLKSLSVMPAGKPIYVLLDDADNLNILQTQVLNTWVSYRTGRDVAFKISTQLAYKTYLTTSRQRIETPHDFREIHVSSIHTGSSSANRYPQWVEKVVQKRLNDFGITADISDFFPEDEEQEDAITAIAESLKKQWAIKRRGYRAGDDAYRYARPDYIKQLGGTSKNRSTYRYSGFQQLVHISSGIIRFFLDNASTMYAQQEIKDEVPTGDMPGGLSVTRIDPTIQDLVVRTAADELMLGGFDRLEQELIAGVATDEAKELKALRNLLRALGGIFQEILLSNRSERRVFSIALSDDPPDEIMKIIRLGVRNGYFYEAAIGTKEGKWRTRRYIMTRRLAPHFTLDPTGFSGYLFVTTELLAMAIQNPKQAVVLFKENRLGSVVDDRQLALGLGND